MRSEFSAGFVRVFVSSARFTTVDISSLVAEFNIYENLSEPFTRADMLVIDSSNVSNAAHFIGQEKVRVQVYDKTEANASGAPRLVLDRNFIVISIQKSTKSYDSVSAYSIEMVEEHVYLNNLTRFSKYYEGKPDEIMKTILKEQLSLDVFQRVACEQEAISIVNPYTSAPLRTAKWLANRCTVNEGSPYYLYSRREPFTDGESVFAQNRILEFKSLDEMLETAPINPERPFKYTMIDNRGGGQRDDLYHKQFSISKYHVPKNQDMIYQFMNSSTSAIYLYLDMNMGYGFENKFKVDQALTPRPKIRGDQSSVDFDFKTDVNGRTANDGYNAYNSQIINSGVFDKNTYNGYEYEEGGNGDKQHTFKEISRSLRNMMAKGAIVIETPGRFFMKYNQTIIGKTIDIEIPKDQPFEHFDPLNTPIDQKRSGRYIIYNVRHKYGVEQYATTLTLAKIHNLDGLKDESGNVYKG